MHLSDPTYSVLLALLGAIAVFLTIMAIGPELAKAFGWDKQDESNDETREARQG